MAQQTCSGARQTSLSYELERLRIRRELEEAGMNRVNVREETARQEPCLSWQGELLALLEDQNRLLCDILGAMTSLTAAQLARDAANGT